MTGATDQERDAVATAGGDCRWHRPGVMRGGVRSCRSCVASITECECSNLGRSPKAKCALCHGSGWVLIGGEGAVSV